MTALRVFVLLIYYDNIIYCTLLFIVVPYIRYFVLGMLLSNRITAAKNKETKIKKKKRLFRKFSFGRVHTTNKDIDIDYCIIYYYV